MSTKAKPSNTAARSPEPRVYHWATRGRNIAYCGTDVTGWKTTPSRGNGSKPVLCDTCKFIADLEDELDAMYLEGKEETR